MLTDLENKFCKKIIDDYVNYESTEQLKTKKELFNNAEMYVYAYGLYNTINQCANYNNDEITDSLTKEQMIFAINYRKNIVRDFVDVCMNSNTFVNYNEWLDIFDALQRTIRKLIGGLK